MDDVDAFCESEEPKSDEGRDCEREADSALPDANVHGTPDASRNIVPELHSLRDVSEGGGAELLPVSPGAVRVEESDSVALSEPGREFLIGRKLFTLQRSLCDDTWDVDVPGHGWISTGFPRSYSAGMAEARFRNDFKGGAKKWIDRRIQDTRRD